MSIFGIILILTCVGDLCLIIFSLFSLDFFAWHLEVRCDQPFMIACWHTVIESCSIPKFESVIKLHYVYICHISTRSVLLGYWLPIILIFQGWNLEAFPMGICDQCVFSKLAMLCCICAVKRSLFNKTIQKLWHALFAFLVLVWHCLFLYIYWIGIQYRADS